MHSLSKGKEGKMQLTSVFSSPRATVGNLLGRTWHPAWKGTDAQSRVTSGLSPCGLPGLAVSNILCDFEQVMPLFGFVFPNQYGCPVSTERREEFRVNLNPCHTLPFLRTLKGSPFLSGHQIKSLCWLAWPYTIQPPLHLLPFFHSLHSSQVLLPAVL